MNLAQFISEWLGRRVDYDHVYNYQCVDLILQYLHDCFGIASGVSGNAIDYWNKPSKPITDNFNRMSAADVQAGDIVVLNGLPGNPYGHIVIGSGVQNATQFEGYEQNGQNGDGDGGNPDENPNDTSLLFSEGRLNDGNQIRTRFIPKSRIAGIWRAKPPVPSTVPDPAQTPNYSVVTTQSGWGLYLIAKAAGRSDYQLPSCWQQIATFNGSDTWQSFNKALRPGQPVKVPYESGHGSDGNQTFQLDTSDAGEYVATSSCLVTDLANPGGTWSVELPEGKHVKVAGTFYAGPMSLPYYLPSFVVEDPKWKGMWPGIPTHNLRLLRVSKPQLTGYERFLTIVGKLFGSKKGTTNA